MLRETLANTALQYNKRTLRLELYEPLSHKLLQFSLQVTEHMTCEN